MGELRYYDGSIAVCEFEHEEFKSETAREDTVKLLLSYAANPSEKTFLKLLTYPGIPWRVLAVDIVPNNRTDWDALERLGVRMSNSESLRDGAFILDYDDGFCTNKLCCSVDVARSRVEQLSADMALLGKLFLLAKGHERHGDVLHSVKVNESKGAVSVSVDMPSKSKGTATKEFTFSFDDLGCIGVKGSNRLTIIVHDDSLSDRIYTPRPRKAAGYFPDSELEQKVVLAGRVLVKLLNQRSGERYCWTESDGLIDSSNDSFSDAMASAIRGGKIQACPWCGCPVLMPRKSSKPFSKQSHQTRYSEKAHALLNSGASVDEVSEEFPFIQRATIRNWLPMGEW